MINKATAIQLASLKLARGQEICRGHQVLTKPEALSKLTNMLEQL